MSKEKSQSTFVSLLYCGVTNTTIPILPKMVLSVARLTLRLNYSISKQQSSVLRRVLLLGSGKSPHGGCSSPSQKRHYNHYSCFQTARSMGTASTTTKGEIEKMTDCSNNHVFDPPPITSLPVAGTNSRFPVRRVYCVGKNYADHVVEMGGDLERSKPIFFTKPSFDGVVYAGPPGFLGSSDSSSSSSSSSSTSIKYPPNTHNLHYEVELVVAIGKELRFPSKDDDDDDDDDDDASIAACDILDCVYGYAVGIDLTRRDLQGEAKSKGLPWDTGKYFDQSAPMGPITPRPRRGIDDEAKAEATSAAAVAAASSFQETLDERTMTLTVNGETRQSVRLEKMIWKVPEIITELSRFFALQPGDLIMTGTPSGVGPVVVGDRIVGTIDGLVEGVDITLV
jgi:fumarylpyruvate hydrolase